MIPREEFIATVALVNARRIESFISPMKPEERRGIVLKYKIESYFITRAVSHSPPSPASSSSFSPPPESAAMELNSWKRTANSSQEMGGGLSRPPALIGGGGGGCIRGSIDDVLIDDWL